MLRHGIPLVLLAYSLHLQKPWCVCVSTRCCREEWVRKSDRYLCMDISLELLQVFELICIKKWMNEVKKCQQGWVLLYIIFWQAVSTLLAGWLPSRWLDSHWIVKINPCLSSDTHWWPSAYVCLKLKSVHQEIHYLVNECHDLKQVTA